MTDLSDLAQKAVASIVLVASSNFVQAQQICPTSSIVSPLEQTRVIRNDQFNYRFEIPVNYRAMAVRNNGVFVFDPASFERAQCLVKNQVPTESPGSISVYVQPVNPGNRSVVDIIRQRPTAKITGTTTVANQTAATYTTDTLRFEENISFFTPNRNNLITISAPFKIEQGKPSTILYGKVFDTVLSTFTFRDEQ